MKRDFLIENGILIGYLGSDRNIVIPNGVTKIYDEAFSNCKRIQSVTFPESVRTIDAEYVFQYCEDLEQICVSPGNALFASLDGVLFNKDFTKLIYCPAAKKGEFVVPQGVTYINEGAFAARFISAIIIHKDILEIGNEAFWDCQNLKNIFIDSANEVYASQDGVLFNKDLTELIVCPGAKSGNFFIPTSVKTIAEDAFACCSQLDSIVIPASVTKIGDRAFWHCQNLKSIFIDSANEVYASQDGVLFNKDLTVLIYYPEGKYGGYIVPPTVKLIEASAFRFCHKLESVIISEGVTEIGDCAFTYSDTLREITIPKSVTKIAQNAFPLYAWKNFTIYTPKNSYAQEYACKNHIQFETCDCV